MKHLKRLHHVALHVADVARSRAFYRDVLELDELPRPDFDFPGAWFALGPGFELHLIGGRTAPVHSASRGNHFAIEVSDIEAVAAFLRAKGLHFRGPKTRPDGAWQIFLADPDGHVIEFTQLV